MIRLAIPCIDHDDLLAVQEALASGYLVQGARVADFEQTIASYVGAQHAIAVSSCTAALHLALLGLGVRPGDLVVVAAYSWIATANVIELCGAQPVFVDVCPMTGNMSSEALAATLQRLMRSPETARRVRAIIPVHVFGRMADMPSICELAEQNRLPVIEDAACALGACLNGRSAGRWGAIGCFSFHPRKAITTGEGGVIVTDDAHLARAMRALRNHGQDPDALSSDFIMPGFNYRLTEFQAALGLTQMRKIDRIIEARRMLARRYDALLQNTDVQPPPPVNDATHVYQSYVALLPEYGAAKRTEIIASLRAKGIETQIGTWHMPLTSYFRARYGYRPGDFPGADAIFARALSLPLYDGLSEEEQCMVVNQLQDTLQQGETNEF
ncbi:MAG: DegT/DnrJ/EryC1/StrS family aminotransferase [candidate division KSB1 bacterium]|nr:DegT/DnrJ/EryC1/StrS family aminotransferase [candidate division KSB1 bacterium]